MELHLIQRRDDSVSLVARVDYETLAILTANEKTVGLKGTYGEGTDL